VPFNYLADLLQDKLIFQMDPFYAECRAYGCISANNRNRKVAVFCYGHTTISAERETELVEKFNILDWQRPLKEYDHPVAQRQPFRTIVKALMHD
jgi:Kinetochore Sim4 complex subunit FTA2